MKLIGGCVLAAFLTGGSAQAAPPTTIVQDTIYRADGTPFQGVVYVQWKSFEASDRSNVAMQTVAVTVTAGALRIKLIPTVGASPASYYQVKYNSDGRTQFVEYWAVPASAFPLRLRDVRIPSPGYAGIVAPPVNTAILINDVSGLRDELDTRPARAANFTPSRAVVVNSQGKLETVVGDSSDCLRADGTTGACGTASAAGPTFHDSETPAGTINGVNSVFTLANPPNPAASLAIYRNGILQKANGDFTLNGNAVSFVVGAVPQNGDILQAWYRTGSSGATQFVDSETPAGTVNGINATFSLQNGPAPATSLAIFRNGLLLKPGVDYTLAGNTVTFLGAAIPQTGDWVQAYYRY